MTKIVGGNDLLPKAMAARLSDSVHYGAAVERIEHDSSSVHTIYKQNGSPIKISGDKLISAVPNTLLRRIDVNPKLPTDKQKTINEMGYVSLSRLTFQVKKRYWIEMGFSGFGYSDIGAEIWHPTFDQKGTRGLLQLYLLGPSSEHVSSLNESEQMSYGIEQVERVFPGLSRHLESVFIHCWDNYPWARGALRAMTPGQVVDFHQNMSTPEGNIHFAGEHTSTWTGYMNGAIESGVRAAKEVNES